MRVWILLATFALGGLPKLPNPPRSVPTVAVGDLVPEVSVLRPDGTPVALASLQKPGRPLVIIFGSFT